jgi:hypothetical protein
MVAAGGRWFQDFDLERIKIHGDGGHDDRAEESEGAHTMLLAVLHR